MRTLILVLVVSGCGSATVGVSLGRLDEDAGFDAGPMDAGEVADAGTDAGEPIDGGEPDAGEIDAGVQEVDAGVPCTTLHVNVFYCLGGCAVRECIVAEALVSNFDLDQMRAANPDCFVWTGYEAVNFDCRGTQELPLWTKPDKCGWTKRDEEACR